MADDAGPARADLTANRPAGPTPGLTPGPTPGPTGREVDPATLGFFELLRRMEAPGLRFGREGPLAREPARLGQRPRLGQATGDIAAVVPGRAEHPPAVAVEVIGLLGPEGPMPLHLTRWILMRLSERWFAGGGAEGETADTAFLDLCNLLQHRMIALYWRAWADGRPGVQAEVEEGGRLPAMLGALAGLGLPGTGLAQQEERRARRFATSLAREARGVERLTAFLADLLAAPVTVEEFVGDWLEIPDPLQTRLGGPHAGLGEGAVIGPRSFQRQSRAEIRVGPLPFERYRALVEDRALRATLRRAIRFAMGEEIAFDLRPVLAPEQAPEPRLGRSGPAAGRLGQSLWIAPPSDRPLGDLRLARFSARPDLPPAGAAA